jgi:hypothetical protein
VFGIGLEYDADSRRRKVTLSAAARVSGEERRGRIYIERGRFV